MTKSKQRVSRHNGRAGKHGVYNPKHNDRQFDVTHADNIDKGRTNLNLYWDWQNGLRTHEQNQSGEYPSFNQVEHDFYEQRYGDYLAGQCEGRPCRPEPHCGRSAGGRAHLPRGNDLPDREGRRLPDP